MAPEGQRSIDNYFNKSNVVIPVDPTHPYPFGNAGRNSVRAYAFYEADLGLHKDFPLWKEGRKLEFRAEFFNLLNKTNFQAPNSTSQQQCLRHYPQHLPGAHNPVRAEDQPLAHFLFPGPLLCGPGRRS